MERAIDNRLVTYAYATGAVWMMIAVIYSLHAIDFMTNDAQWAMDKINDRVFEINLLIICSFCFLSLRIKYFCYATCLYVFYRGVLEVAFILDQGDYSEVLWFCSGLYAAMVLFIFLILHKFKHGRTHSKYRG